MAFDYEKDSKKALKESMKESKKWYKNLPDEDKLFVLDWIVANPPPMGWLATGKSYIDYAYMECPFWAYKAAQEIRKAMVGL